MIYINLGRREQGKTTLAAFLAQRSRASLIVVFDPRGLFPASDRVTSETGIDHMFGLAETGDVSRIVITPDTMLRSAFDATCAELKQWLRMNRGSVAFVVDEARMVDTEGDPFDWLLRCASRTGITIILTAHRPKDVPVNIRAIADVWCVFPTTQAHDYEVFENQFNEAAVAAIRRLKDRQFVAWDDTTATFKTYDDPSLWYVALDTAVPVKHAPLLDGGKTSPEKKDLLSDL